MTEQNEKIVELEWQLQEVAKDNDYYQAENKRLEEQIEKMKCCDNCEHWDSPVCKKARKVHPDNPRKIRACDKDMAYWELREDFNRFSYDD